MSLMIFCPKGHVMDKLDQMKWWDALDQLRLIMEVGTLASCKSLWNALQLARQSRHPDAQWLCSLFPQHVTEVTADDVIQVMTAHVSDGRALFIRSHLGFGLDLHRAAELGYAPAQAAYAEVLWEGDSFFWASKAAAQGDRRGLFKKGCALWYGQGCDEDCGSGMALVKEAAELGHAIAMMWVGQNAFGAHEWQRYRWWGRSAARDCSGVHSMLFQASSEQMLLLEEGKGSVRAVFEIGAALKPHLDLANARAFGKPLGVCKQSVQLCVELHDKWCAEAKKAISCWTVVATRLGVVKDVRLLIAQMLWDDGGAWSWGKSGNAESDAS